MGFSFTGYLMTKVALGVTGEASLLPPVPLLL